MAETFTVLTVCTGNVHRSALASDLLATWASWYLPATLRERVVVGSAGTRAPVGEPMGGMTCRVAAALAADDRGHRARALTDVLISEADLVLAATRAHRDEVVRRMPRAMRRTFTIREAARIATLFPGGQPASLDDLAAVVGRMAELRVDAAPALASDDDVVDPQGKGTAGMDDMVREEVPALAQLAITLWGMPRGDAAEYVRVSAAPASLRNSSVSR
jgi:protein-tyrosine phosphatase